MAGSSQATAHRYTYVPTLRTKVGEAKALGQLSAGHKARIFPIFQVTSAPPTTFATTLNRGWSTPLALDGLWNFTQSGSLTAYTTLFHSLRQLGLQAIPSVDVAAQAAYVAGVQQLLGSSGPNLVVRANLTTLPAAAAWVAQQGWQPNSIHLVIDVGHVAEYDPANFASYVLHALNSAAPHQQGWRTITLSSSAAPKDAGAASLGLNSFSRFDWMLWNAVAPNQGYQLHFGDFGSAHRELTEPPGAAMARATVSVRYTVDNHWLFIKGRQTGGPQGLPMHQQYRAHATQLTQHSAFGGVPVCWGDGQIQGVVSGGVSAGSRQTWACKTMNRHLAKVADQLP